jgi:uncharacterized membrane protein
MPMMVPKMQKLFKGKLSAPEIFLIATLLVFGLLVCFMLPMGGGFDEETHLARIWEMSALVFLPNEGLGREMPLPTIFREISYRRDVLVRAVEPDFLSEFARTPIDGLDFTYGRIETRSVYSPPLLLPQAFVMRYLGRYPMERGIDIPALVSLYAIRLVGLFSYILLAWLAVRWIPFGKWTLAILAVTPTALLQAATIGADAISNGIGLLFIGGSLALCRREAMGWREWGQLVSLYMLLFFAKVNLAPLALLPFLLISPSQFQKRSQYLLLYPAVAILFLIETVWWSVIALPAYVAAPDAANAVEQLRHILANPMSFTQVVLGDFFLVHGAEYFLEWVAIYAFGYWPVPGATYIFFVLGLVLALFLVDDWPSIRRGERVSLFIVFLLACVMTVTSLYLSFSPVGSEIIRGVQGRYFIPIAPLLFLSIGGLTLARKWQVTALPVMAFAGVALLLYTVGLILSYHVACGSAYYKLDLCYQPVYKNWAPDDRYSPAVSQQMTLTQEIVPECNEMTQLRVWVNGSEADPSTSVRFSLHDPHLDRTLVDDSVLASQLPAGGWYAWNFPAESASSGRLYILTIQSENPDGERGVHISYSLRPEYPPGKLFENQEPVSHDIIFQYGCLAGLQKIVQGSGP